MDIWAWVEKLHGELIEAGQERVADMLYSLPDLVCDGKAAQAQALFPEALAAAKALKNPWMEVFFRHWQMRLRLGALAEGETALPEAVSLLEFAHRKECLECPQSVCVTQDIAACYSYVDGPGWEEERKAVCAETLARIDPTWACYACLSSEYADALSDGGAHEKALAYLEEAMRRLTEAGSEVSRDLHHQRVSLMRLSGRPAEALKELDRVDTLKFAADGDSDLREAAVHRAYLLAETGKYDEALDILPGWEELTPGEYMDMLEVHYRIALGAPENNTWQLGRLFQEGAAYMHRVQAHRRAIRLAELHARLALARGAKETARRALSLMEEHLPELRVPLGADKRIAEIRAATAAAPPIALPVPAERLPEYLADSDDRNPERDYELLRAALAERPDDTEIVNFTTSALRAVGAESEALALLQETVERFPEKAEEVIVELIGLIPVRDTESMSRLAALMEKHLPDMALWVRAHIAFRAENWAEAGAYLDAFIAGRPKVIGARRFRAEVAVRGKDFATATRMRKEVIVRMLEEEEDPADDQWDLLVCASAEQNWALVRQTCIDMGFEGVLPGDEPFDDEGRRLRIRYREDGGRQDYVGVRTGPVTAKIIEVSVPGVPLRAGDVVVFDPSPLEPEPEDPEEREYFMIPYHMVHPLSFGGCKAWLLDGADPSMEEWEPFRAALAEKGCLLWVRSGSGYRVADPDTPNCDGDAHLAEGKGDDDEASEWGLPGIYVALAAPAGMPPKELDRLLTELTKDWKHPLSWLALVKAAGGNEKRHLEIIERYGL